MVFDNKIINIYCDSSKQQTKDFLHWQYPTST